ncbi:MAG TPA: hypothetical protein VFT43_09930, partial [Candidatus Polarisedimenticolia bacterium]|nr:hypothetical protein [Candidatus Polarisedimenticolia bacterium]
NQNACDDGNACTTADVCQGGVCVGGPPADCNDGNVCTKDSCDRLTGCMHTPLVTVQAVCSISPSTLNINAQGNTFSMGLTLLNVCDPNNPTPILASSVPATHISKANGSIFPDPASLPCPGPGGDTLFETGLFEDLAARTTVGSSLSLRFDLAHDGSCLTLDGNRQDLLGALADVPDNTVAPVCLAGTASGQAFQCCTTARVRNRGTR